MSAAEVKSLPHTPVEASGWQWLDHAAGRLFAFRRLQEGQVVSYVNVRELKEKRRILLLKAKRILNDAEAQKRDLTAEESQEFDRLTAEADRISQQIEEIETRDGVTYGPDGLPEPIAGRRGQPGADPGDALEERGYVPPELRAALEHTRSASYKKAFWRAIRRWPTLPTQEDMEILTAPAVRSLVVGIDAQGGYLAPEDFERQVIQSLAEENVMRRLGTVQRFTSDRTVPVVAAVGSAAWISEEQEFPASDPSFGVRRLGAYKLGRIVLVSEELLADAAVDIEGLLRDLIARSFAEAEEQAFIAGTGTGQPTGVIMDAEVGKMAAANNAITADELIDLAGSLRAPYRRRATFLMHDSTLFVVRKLKDNQGQYLWQPGLREGQPDTLLGHPVVTSPAMPPIGPNNVSVLFGDFSYYWIAQRVGLVLQVLQERYAEKGQVGFRAYERVDGRLMLPEAVKALKHPA